MVWNLRNGVLAITRDGRVAVMNDIAYRVLGLKPRAERHRPAVRRSAAATSPTSPASCRRVRDRRPAQPRRNAAAARRARSSATRSRSSRTTRGRDVGATLFFKDLTRVEQIEERERLRDRLAALGEMAAAIAHEVKNPLASIEVMAGVLKRQLPDSQDAQTASTTSSRKRRWPTPSCVEVLEFVRPIRLQVERRLARRRHPGRDRDGRDARRARRREVTVRHPRSKPLLPDPGGSASAAPALHEPADQRVRGARTAAGDVDIRAVASRTATRTTGRIAATAAAAVRRQGVATTARGFRPK